MRLQFIGCGDAFGSGGRFNTCFHLSTGGNAFLIDCGASSLVALRKAGVDPNGIAAVFITHLHGDHFGGLPFLILDGQLMSRRTAPFAIAGPPGLGARLHATMEALYPGSATASRKFALDIHELEPERSHTVADVTVTPFPARHSAGAIPFALRLESGGKVVAYTGDSEWTEALIPAGRGADLFIMECWSYDRPVRGHLDWRTLAAHLGEIGAKRVILTHLGPDMLARAGDLGIETAEDGKVVEF